MNTSHCYIVQIYRSCGSDNLLPHTLTELYSQLCLTYLNRYLQNMVDKLEDLPGTGDLYVKFLLLSWHLKE